MSSGSNSQNHGYSNPNKIHINPKFAQKQNLNPTNSATTSNHNGIYHSAHSEHKIVHVNPKVIFHFLKGSNLNVNTWNVKLLLILG